MENMLLMCRNNLVMEETSYEDMLDFAIDNKILMIHTTDDEKVDR